MSAILPRKFEARFEQRLLVGDIISHNGSAQALVLHGAGRADRAGFRLIRENLFAKGVSTCAFDFIGHGETGGELLGSSLQERTRQVLAVLRHRPLAYPMAVIAASMGAYTAVKLLEHVNVQILVLLVPAMYTRRAYEVPFGPQFSRLIRQPQSWVDSDAWDILERFTGRLLVLAGENDTVIPADVIQRIYDSAENVGKRVLYVAPAASHSALTDLHVRDPQEFEHVMQMIGDIILG
jgi:pimeloyl-ACP methyl ester carboxylesterase